MGTPGVQRKPVLSTMWGAKNDETWTRLVDVVRTDRPGTLIDLVRLWRESADREVIVLRGSVSFADRYRDLVFAALLKTRRNPPRVLITDATWEPRSSSLEERTPRFLHPLIPWMVRGFVHLVDGPHVRYAVLSRAEQETFPDLWGVDRNRVVFTPFLHTLYEGLENTAQISDGGYLFAGGDSMRDYGLLEAAIAGQPYQVKVASRWRPSSPLPNLTVGPTSHEDFIRQMANARAVVVPLGQAARSSGQQTYLNAMVLGKPVVVTRSKGVDDYIEDGVTGVIVDPHPLAIREALAQVMDPKNAEQYAQMGRAAREMVISNYHDLGYKKILLLAAGLDPSIFADGDLNQAEAATVAAQAVAPDQAPDEEGLVV